MQTLLRNQVTHEENSSNRNHIDVAGEETLSLAVSSRNELDKIFASPSFKPLIKDVLVYIRIRSRQFGIDGICDPDEILSNAFIRAINQIDQGKDIPNIVGWLKLTSFNIIREMRRSIQKQKQLSEKISIEHVHDYAPEIIESHSEQSIRISALALTFLSKLDQRIIHHRFISEYSWQEVCIHLAQEGFLDKKDYTDTKIVGRIRRRGQRAISKLKEIYFSLCE
jgi:DNA-directed RNA polymerase specialized sigma24 family protein